MSVRRASSERSCPPPLAAVAITLAAVTAMSTGPLTGPPAPIKGKG